MVELLVAMALLTGALLPVAYSITSEKRYARACYQRAVAMEIVDGEMETLVAGEWRAFRASPSPGGEGRGEGEPLFRKIEYKPNAGAATNLAPGRFLLTIADKKLRLEWRPELKQHGGAVVREALIK